MASIFDKGRETLAAAAAEASETVAFRHGKTTTSVQARIGSKLFKSFDGPVAVSVMTRRFIISRAALSTLPVNGDTIVWRNRSYRLGCPDGGPPWRWHGATNDWIVVYAADCGSAE